MDNSIVQQLPNESSKAFEAARLYFELGPDRSLRQVAERLGKNPSLIGRWSRENEWVARAGAYDAAALAVEEAARGEVLAVSAAEDAALWVRRARELRESEWGLRRDVVSKARELLAGLESVGVVELIELLAFAGELGRSAVGVESGEEEQGDGQGETSRGSGITVQVAFVNSAGAAGPTQGPAAHPG